jgi:hypothetical protein
MPGSFKRQEEKRGWERNPGFHLPGRELNGDTPVQIQRNFELQGKHSCPRLLDTNNRKDMFDLT